MFGSPTPTKQTRCPASSRAAATIIISDFENAASRHRRGLEQLDRVAVRVVEEDLLAAGPADDVVAERGAGVAEAVDERVEVVDLDDEPVPAAGLGRPPSGIGRAADDAGPASHRSRSPRRTRANAGQHLLDDLELEQVAVERQRPGDVGHEVADGGHQP